ncbi:MAG: MFS transporter, partial [archaeon]
KQKDEYNFTNIAKLSIVGLIASLAAAYVDTIWAVYLNSFVDSIVLVGFLSAMLTIISFFSYFLFIPVIERSDKAKIYFYTMIFFIITYVLFFINHNFYFFLILAVVITILYTLRITSFGILVRDYSKNKNVSRNEGIIYTFMNIAWVIGPLVAGYVASGFGVNWVFILAAFFIFIGLILFKTSEIKDLKGKKITDNNFFINFVEFFKDKDRVLAYTLGGGVNLWWSFIYLFIPLMIIRNGLGEIWIGYFLFAVAIPLILFSYISAKWAGKHGFKRLFKIGYLMVSIIAFACFFVSNIYFILSLLVLASVGLAMLESTTEAYFFDILRGKEKYRFYGPYNTAIDSGRFTGKIFASVLLIFLAFNFLFLLFGGFMFLLFLLSFKTKNIRESRRSK